MIPKKPFVVVDFFCGAGGVTIGIVQSKRAKVVAALNHDPKAIEAHDANHPETIHFEDDIRKAGIEKEIEDIVKRYRKKGYLIIFWCSAECTNYSQAKGGASRDRDSRTLVNEMFRYIDASQPDYVWFENVKEFKKWGPLIPKKDKKTCLNIKDKSGKLIWVPDPKKIGRYYYQWIYKFKERGYNYKQRMLNAADYGAHTSRTRYFGMFAKGDLPIIFPKPTHARNAAPGSDLKPWNACREKLQLKNEGMSIFGRQFVKGKKPLAPNTLRRIAYGIKKYCLDKQFIMQYYGTINNSKIDKPLPVITTKDRHALVSLEENQFITQHFHNCQNANSINKPLGAIVTKDLKQLITVENQFIDQGQYTEKHVSELDKPLPTINTHEKGRLITVDNQFIDKYYSGKYNVGSIDKPLDAITTQKRPGLVTVEKDKEQFISKHYSGNHASSIEEPLHTITTKDHNTLVSLDKQFCTYKYTRDNAVSAIDDPINTITTLYNHISLITIDESAEEVLEHIENEKQEFINTYFENDPEIRDFLLHTNYIKDIKMRFLTPQELKEIQGFPADYQLPSANSHAIKFIGNSVVPVIPKAMCEAIYQKLKSIGFWNDEATEIAAA